MKNDQIMFLAGVIMLTFAVLYCLVFLTGCTDDCEPAEMQCYGNTVEICNADERWELVQDCDIAGDPTWDYICCDTYSDRPLCLPRKECP